MQEFVHIARTTRDVTCLSSQVTRQLFLYTFHRAHNNQPGKRMHIEVLHGNPGIPCIYLERYNKYQLLQEDSSDQHRSLFHPLKYRFPSP